MHQESQNLPKVNGLIVQPSTGLVTMPDGDSSALSEIINRSLAQIQTNRALAVPKRQAGEERDFEIAPGVSIVMCWIPPGEFLMGSPEDEEDRQSDENRERQHLVRLTKGFWLAKTQTTQAEWQAVMRNNPSAFKGNNLPVDRVSWLDVCGNESRTGGFLGAVNRLAPQGVRFDLPTEAQWEYACRAGTAGPYYGDLDEIAWYEESSDDITHPVGQKKPNAWGLHDMQGIVWEWCADWYGDYPDDIMVDPAGPVSGSGRVLRGGPVVRGIEFLSRVAFRHDDSPETPWECPGFRVAAVWCYRAASGEANETRQPKRNTR
jgi:formylglycine-generating enzyme required for sulfatase activity